MIRLQPCEEGVDQAVAAGRRRWLPHPADGIQGDPEPHLDPVRGQIGAEPQGAPVGFQARGRAASGFEGRRASPRGFPGSRSSVRRRSCSSGRRRELFGVEAPWLRASNPAAVSPYRVTGCPRHGELLSFATARAERTVRCAGTGTRARSPIDDQVAHLRSGQKIRILASGMS